MNRKIKAVLFDLDGTLLDTLTDLMNAVNHALIAFGYPKRSRDEVRRFVGNGIDTLVARAVPGGKLCPYYAEICAETRKYYAAHCEDTTAPYPEIPEMLGILREQGYRIGVLSNKPDAQVKYLCAAHFPGLIDEAAGAKEGIRLKPAPDSLLALIEALHVTKAEAVYAGDSDVDLETARNAGIDCISVLWGFRDRALLESAGGSKFIQSPHEIQRFL